MAFPTLEEIQNRISTDITEAFEGVNPFLPASFFLSLAQSMGGRFYEFYRSLDLLESRLFLLTSEDNFLDGYASIKNIVRLNATPAVGDCVFTGVVNINIPINTQLNSDSGQIYETTAAGVITNFTDTTASFSVSGIVVTVTSTDHGLASGMQVNVSGGLPNGLVGTYTIDVTASDEFQYTVSTIVGDGVYAPGTVSADYATVSVTSLDSGIDTNLVSGSTLSLQSPLAGIDNTVYVSFTGITGGADVESDDAFRQRVLFAYRNPIAYVSVSMLENLLYSIPGITRVWVRKVFPAIGLFTIYYVRDDETPIFPSAQDLINVRNEIPTPADIPESNIIVESPIEKSIEFTFGSLTPDTGSMRAAIEASLQQFFRDSVAIGVQLQPSNTITVNQYSRPIQSAIDVETGEGIIDFTLDTVDGVPPANIVIADNELPTLGTVTYSP